MTMHQHVRDSVEMVGSSSTTPALSITIPEPWPERRGGVCNYPVVSFFCRAVRRQTLHVIPPSVCSILGPKAHPQCTTTIKSTGTPLSAHALSSDSDGTLSSTSTTSSSGSELSNTADSSTPSPESTASGINSVTTPLDSSASTSSPSLRMQGQATPNIPSTAPTYTSSSNSASLQKTGAVSKSNIGAIAGGVIGGILFLVLLSFLIFKVMKRHRRLQALTTEQPYECQQTNRRMKLALNLVTPFELSQALHGRTRKCVSSQSAEDYPSTGGATCAESSLIECGPLNSEDHPQFVTEKLVDHLGNSTEPPSEYLLSNPQLHTDSTSRDAPSQIDSLTTVRSTDEQLATYDDAQAQQLVHLAIPPDMLEGRESENEASMRIARLILRAFRKSLREQPPPYA